MYTIRLYGAGHRDMSGIQTIERAIELATLLEKVHLGCVVTVLDGDIIVPWKD